MANNFYNRCQKCGKYERKQLMNKIYLGRSSSHPKSLCWLCDSCFVQFLEEYEISM